MSFSSRIDAARLTVFLDLRQPLAYLSLLPTIDLGTSMERDWGVELNWLPVQVPALRAPTAVVPNEDRGVRHRRFRAQAIAREIETYSEAQDLIVRDYYRDPDPSAANLGWLWVREHAPDRLTDYLKEIFRAYWMGELDPADEASVAELIRAQALDVAQFESGRSESGAASLAALGNEIDERGLAVGAPAYWIDGELFWGGQHLEMIRWILLGREGRGPI